MPSSPFHIRIGSSHYAASALALLGRTCSHFRCADPWQHRSTRPPHASREWVFRKEGKWAPFSPCPLVAHSRAPRIARALHRSSAHTSHIVQEGNRTRCKTDSDGPGSLADLWHRAGRQFSASSPGRHAWVTRGPSALLRPATSY